MRTSAPAEYTAQKMKFSIKDFFSKYDLVTFTEEILNGKLHFLCRCLSLPDLCTSTILGLFLAVILARAYQNWLLVAIRKNQLAVYHMLCYPIKRHRQLHWNTCYVIRHNHQFFENLETEKAIIQSVTMKK